MTFVIDTVCTLREAADNAEHLAKWMARDERERLMLKYRKDLLDSAARLRVALDDIDAALTPQPVEVRHGKAA